jgi:putative membrane protein
MNKMLAHWVICAFALALTTWILPGVRVTSPLALLAAALVLGLLNALLKPVLVLLTLPITVLTLGLFDLVLNAALVALAAALVPGFVVSGFGAALLGALILSLLSTLLGGFLQPERNA